MEGKSSLLKETEGTAGQEAAPVPAAEAHPALAAVPAPGAGSPTAAHVAAAALLVVTVATVANPGL